MDLNTITEVARPRQRSELPAWRAGDAWLGGGTWLFSEPQTAARSRLIDLATLGWQPLRSAPNGLEIAATCTIAQLDGLTAPVEWIAAPLIDQCCRAFLASFKIWNMATVGGNLCMSLPAGPMISLTAALDGICTLWSADGARAPRAGRRFRHRAATQCAEARRIAAADRSAGGGADAAHGVPANFAGAARPLRRAADRHARSPQRRVRAHRHRRRRRGR